MSTLLGFLDSKIKDEFSGEAWRTNKIGGHLCLSSKIKECELNELKQLLICEKCNKQMIFIGQISCPLEIDNYDRYLIFYACNTKKCNQWSVIRFIHDQDKTELIKSKEKTIKNENSWLDDQNDWNNDEINDNLINLTTENDKELNDNKNQFIILNEDNNEFIQPYYLDIELEDQTEDLIKLDSHIDELLKQYKEKNNSKDTVKDTVKDDEYSKIDETDILGNYNNDLLTYKFYKKLSLVKGQVIRYSWNQKPLINRSNLNLESINCDNCGSEKVFELQLMPSLINYLKIKNKLLNIEFASVLIYTCKQNCSNKMLTKESFIVLDELEQDLPDYLLN